MSFMRELKRLAPILVFAAVIALAMAWTVTFDGVPPMLVRSFQPSFFPQLVAAAILVLGAIAAINDVRRGVTNDLGGIPREFYASVLVLLIAGLLVRYVDFLLAIMVGAAGISAVWGERRPIVLGGLGLVAPLLLLLLFDEALQIRFPRGLLLDAYYSW